MANWISDHDERWSFILPYMALAIILSVFVSLFWLVVLLGIHAYIEHKRLPSWGATLMAVQLDIALIIAAVTMEVYLDYAVGLIGAGHATRGGALVITRILSRVPAWQHILKGVLYSLDDLLQLVRMRKGTQGGGSNRLPLLLGGMSTCLLILSPFILPFSFIEIGQMIVESFYPFGK